MELIADPIQKELKDSFTIQESYYGKTRFVVERFFAWLKFWIS